MSQNLEVGSLLEMSLGAKEYARFNRDWIVVLKVLGTIERTRTPVFGSEPQEVVVVYSDVRDRPGGTEVGRIFRVFRVVSSVLQSSRVRFVATLPLTDEENGLRDHVFPILEDESAAPFRSLWEDEVTEQLHVPMGDDLRDELRDLFDVPYMRYLYDCGDHEVGTHCFACGHRLLDNLARCPGCDQIRKGFEGVRACVMEWQQPASQDPNVMTDVQAPDGMWFPAFDFLEFVANGVWPELSLEETDYDE